MFSTLQFPPEYASDLKALGLPPSATLADVQYIRYFFKMSHKESYNRLQAYPFLLELKESERISQIVRDQLEPCLSSSIKVTILEYYLEDSVILSNFKKIKNTLLMIKAELESYFPSVLASIVIEYLEITLADYITKIKDLFDFMGNFGESPLQNAYKLLHLESGIPFNFGAYSLNDLRLGSLYNTYSSSQKLIDQYFDRFTRSGHEREIPEELIFDMFNRIHTGSTHLLDLLKMFSPFRSVDSLVSLPNSLDYFENFFISKLPKIISVADRDKLLLSAVQCHYLKAVQHIDMRYSNTMDKNPDSLPVLHMAMAFPSNNHLNMLSTLLDMKADINLKYSEFGRQIPRFMHRHYDYIDGNNLTALHLAVVYSRYYLDSIELLLERKAQFDILDSRNKTALQLAVEKKGNKSTTIFNLFLKHDTGPLFKEFKRLHSNHSSKLGIFKKNSMRYRLFHNEINSMREVFEHIQKEPTSKKSQEVIEMLKKHIVGPSL